MYTVCQVGVETVKNILEAIPAIAHFIGKGQPRKRYAGGICRSSLIRGQSVDIPVLLYLLLGVGKMGKEL